MVPKQTLSVHLITRFVGCAWQSCYILFNNRGQQPWLGHAWGGKNSPPLSIVFLMIFPFCGFSWEAAHLRRTAIRCAIFRESQRKPGLLFLGAVPGKPPASVCLLLSEEELNAGCFVDSSLIDCQDLEPSMSTDGRVFRDHVGI